MGHSMKDIDDVENNSEGELVTYDFTPKQSDWGMLNPILFGRISLCDKKGVSKGGQVVTGIALDADMTIESQYSTPFENSNPESRLPVLMGMMQSGDWVNTVDKVLGSFGFIGDGGTGLSEDAKAKLNQLEGRSNFTKVNSTQIYTSSASVRLNVTIFFEAWYNALHEVEHQIASLQQWSLPVELSEDSAIGNLATEVSLQSLFPSKVPPYVSFTYGNKRYSPLLLESVGAPLVTPMDDQGNRLIVEVNITLVSRQAWDQKNIANLY